ncbi:MAG: hypothetical protein JSS07_06640 [Proteobacteria bacterium]|nr:hypothetical protein [Pseudomonadota bacterium]
MISSWSAKDSDNSHGNQKYADMVILCALTLR